MSAESPVPKNSAASMQTQVVLLLITAILFPIGLMVGAEVWHVPVPSVKAVPQQEEHALPIAPPSRLRIPSLHIDVPVEHLGLTADGDMDIPDRIDTVGWFQLGYLPGQGGNAVMAGHVNGPSGEPGVFARLEELSVGDVIDVEHGSGSQLRFLVREIAVYPYDASPMEKIFGTAKRPLLNLITCNGVWDTTNGTYNQRLVVYTELLD